MYMINSEGVLTLSDLGKVLSLFLTKELPKLRLYRNYYDGQLNIMLKLASDTGKPCNKIVTNYCYNIVHNYMGYITGKPIQYANESDISSILDVLSYNDVNQEDSEYIRSALIYGVAYEINYIDSYGKQRFKLLDPREVIPIYDNTLDNNLLYVVRFWRENILENQTESYMVEVYSSSSIKTYRSSSGFSSFSLLSEVPHFYGQVPITIFKLNQDEKSSFDQVMTLQDAYNKLQSAEVDDFESFADAYLLIKGAIADADDLENMKQKRVLCVDADCDASYITKSINDTLIENMLKNIKDLIHMIAQSPDFTDEKFMAQSGVAIRYKLLGFENESSNIEAEMKKALQKRIELICTILNLTNEEQMWRDIEIIFTRNLPSDITDTLNMVNALRGLVSDYTLLSQIPFVKDVDAELLRIKELKQEQMEMYNFNINTEQQETEE